MGSARHLAFVLLLLTSGMAARADETPPAPEAERKTLEGFADAHTGCREWSDGCTVCLRHDDGTLRCSLPGIACQPKPIACRPAGTTPVPPVTPNETEAPAPQAVPPSSTPLQAEPPKTESPKTEPQKTEPPKETAPAPDATSPAQPDPSKDKDAH